MNNRNMLHKLSTIILCVLCCLSGCTAGEGDNPTNAGEFQYFTFPKTDWGMSQEDVLDAWDLSYSDIDMLPANPDSYYMGIVFRSNKKITVLGYPADVIFQFAYLTRGGGARRLRWG